MVKLEKVMTDEQFFRHISTSTSECVAYAKEKALKGDVNAILAAIDAYSYRHPPMMNVGDLKRPVLEAEVERVKPKIVLALGTFIGYSAVLFANKLKQVSGPGAHVYSFEISPELAQKAMQTIEHAGLADMVTLIVGPFSETYGKLKALGVETADLISIDHEKESYVSDLQRIEQSGLLKKGTVVIADNLIAPGVPDYLEYMNGNPNYDSRLWEGSLEYVEEIEDAIMISTFVGAP